MAKRKSAEKAIREIRRKTRRRFTAEEKVRILYYRWSKDFLGAGKKRLAGDSEREATSNEVTALRRQLAQLKELVAETMLHNRILKKTAAGFDSDEVDT